MKATEEKKVMQHIAAIYNDTSKTWNQSKWDILKLVHDHGLHTHFTELCGLVSGEHYKVEIENRSQFFSPGEAKVKTI